MLCFLTPNNYNYTPSGEPPYNYTPQVNMPADSFESPLTLAACGGHVELAMLLLERGANIEEVNDEGYTPLMEASREGHEEMVALLLSQV